MKVGDTVVGHRIAGGVCGGTLECIRNNGKQPIELECRGCGKIVGIPQPKLSTVGTPAEPKRDDIPF